MYQANFVVFYIVFTYFCTSRQFLHMHISWIIRNSFWVWSAKVLSNGKNYLMTITALLSFIAKDTLSKVIQRKWWTHFHCYDKCCKNILNWRRQKYAETKHLYKITIWANNCFLMYIRINQKLLNFFQIIFVP